MPKRNRNRSGFTLTEVIVASSLLLLAIIPILRALTGSHIASDRIKHKSNSLVMAQAKMEDITARSVYGYELNFDENNSQLGDSYYCDVVDSPLGQDLRKIVVTVGYDKDKDNALDQDEQLISLETLVARRI